MALDQQTRFLNLTTPLGNNTLLLTAFTGHEEMSRLFSFQLEMISDNNSISAPAIVGKDVTFSVELPDNQRRHFHGFVSQFIAGTEERGRRNYRAEVVPWLWFLTQTADCRIFQQKTIPQIVEQIFSDLGFSDFSFKLKENHPQWEYCVQYRETDFNFVSRLLEQEGMFYFFQHSDGKHQMIISDNKDAYQDCPESEVDLPSDYSGVAVKDHLTDWEHRYQFCSGKWAQTDYNFEKPSTNLMSKASSIVSLPGISKYEVYDYPGEYEEKPDGETDTKMRMEEEEAGFDTVYASSTCRTFMLGGKFRVGSHTSGSEKGKSYAITSIRHIASEPLAYETGGTTGEVDYRNNFMCIPDSVVFRPERSTAKPIVSGIQTAVVVGPQGEEIYCDKYGRVKVQFYWDREGKRDENSSCWIRAAQSIAGRKWGFMAIPRIGQEVVVEFLEGDPDRPLITGCVYNAEQMPHYGLPDERTKTYIKTNSSLGGEGYNELLFEDKKDDERLFMHAQKDMDVRVQNDHRTRIYGHKHQIVGWEKDGEKGGDLREQVWEDKQLNIKRHHVEHIEGNWQVQVGNGEAEEGGNLDIVLENTKKEKIGGDSHLIIAGAHKEKVDGDVLTTIGGNQHTKVSGNVAVEAGAVSEIHLKAGMKVIIEAGMQLSLVGPGGFVDIGPAGVTIQGVMVKINSGGAAGSGSGCQVEDPEEAEQAAPAEPAQAWDSQSGSKSAPD